MLPDLLSGRQANSRAEAPLTAAEPTDGKNPEEPGAPVARAVISDVSDDELARYRELVCLKRR